ncbi:histidine phosphatase family protein [Piscinibacter gummiphilus]|uniref:Histidine phosphatase family protein n=1 Tax=Piscinibacter gummiphilus TaxID=946333 RepID=A0ABZ0CXE1_9BURK|nr:histidine phosphatase family protein [Piscinibacter gummiphilus]WOB07543.1 histidine phosphatase family protein [Piscinibacter gummiphilus]
MQRRALLIATSAWPWAARADDAVAARLAAGGVVIAFRHALAPGTFDPPGFRLDDCGTQRNLNDEGRAHAQRIGAWLRERRLSPAAVRSSPWCRCVDTARLAFDRADPWLPLGSPRAGSEAVHDAALRELRASLAAVARSERRFEVWVTHQFVLTALVGGHVASGEGLVLQAGAGHQPTLVARLSVA